MTRPNRPRNVERVRLPDRVRRRHLFSMRLVIATSGECSAAARQRFLAVPTDGAFVRLGDLIAP